MDKLILASSSPRRKALLQELGIPLSIVHPDIDETIFDHEIPEKRVVSLAEAKAFAAEKLCTPVLRESSRFLLSADTLVAFMENSKWYTIGKPSNYLEAEEMLRQLSGRAHIVFTGLCLLDLFSKKTFTTRSETIVNFGQLTQAEIHEYIETEEWIGAAGGYRLQGRGSLFIDKIEGSWSGVVGLPLRELYGILVAAGYALCRA